MTSNSDRLPLGQARWQTLWIGKASTALVSGLSPSTPRSAWSAVPEPFSTVPPGVPKGTVGDFVDGYAPGTVSRCWTTTVASTPRCGGDILTG